MTMQNWALGHDTDVPIPVYSVAAGMTWIGADHEVPFHVNTEPLRSAARQNEVVGHEIESSPPCGSTASLADHWFPAVRTDTPVPFTMAHSVVSGQEMAVGSDGPEVSEEVQGDGSCAQVEPFQSSTEVPTTAVHAELVGHETPTRPAW
jgi:hypothetical protein